MQNKNLYAKKSVEGYKKRETKTDFDPSFFESIVAVLTRQSY